MPNFKELIWNLEAHWSDVWDDSLKDDDDETVPVPDEIDPIIEDINVEIGCEMFRLAGASRDDTDIEIVDFKGDVIATLVLTSDGIEVSTNHESLEELEVHEICELIYPDFKKEN